ncbi:MAG: ribonuclease P protein component [Helicobacteraceae bacterium]|nr:ribonuclease P protein component [Helicobacteraceae bacterium]
MLKKNGEFQFVYRRGKSQHSRSLVLFYLPQQGVHKYGFTASKKVGNAVVRSRSKRRMRAIFAEQCPHLKDGSYVLVAKEALASTTYEQLQFDLTKILQRAGCITDDQKSTT